MALAQISKVNILNKYVFKNQMIQQLWAIKRIIGLGLASVLILLVMRFSSILPEVISAQE